MGTDDERRIRARVIERATTAVADLLKEVTAGLDPAAKRVARRELKAIVDLLHERALDLWDQAGGGT
jgi:hypothetical protein